MESNTWCPRLTAAMILLGSLVQRCSPDLGRAAIDRQITILALPVARMISAVP